MPGGVSTLLPSLPSRLLRHTQILSLVQIGSPDAVCDGGGGCGRSPAGFPLLLAPLTDLFPHNDCINGYWARSRHSKTIKLVANTTPSKKDAETRYCRQLQVWLAVHRDGARAGSAHVCRRGATSRGAGAT